MSDVSTASLCSMAAIGAVFAGASAFGSPEFAYVSQTRTLDAYVMATGDDGVILEDSGSGSIDHLESWYRQIALHVFADCVDTNVNVELDSVLEGDRLLLEALAAGGVGFCEGTSGDSLYTGESVAVVEFTLDAPAYVRLRWDLWQFVSDATVRLFGPSGVIFSKHDSMYKDDLDGGFNVWLEPGTYIARAEADTLAGDTGDYPVWSYATSILELTITTPGDVDGDQDVDFEDLTKLLLAWGPCPEVGPCFEDVDANGAVDFIDLLTLLGNFGDA